MTLYLDDAGTCDAYCRRLDAANPRMAASVQRALDGIETDPDDARRKARQMRGVNGPKLLTTVYDDIAIMWTTDGVDVDVEYIGPNLWG